MTLHNLSLPDTRLSRSTGILALAAWLTLPLLSGCGPAKQPSAEDLNWMCSGDAQCVAVCKEAAVQYRLAEQCQTLKQRALTARKAGIVLGKGGDVEILGRSDVALTPSQIASRALRSIAVIETKDGLGTGFVVGQGRLATNLHVVAGADSFKVTFPGGERPEVSDVAAYDPDHDLAVLTIDSTPPILTLSAPDDMRLGEPVVAIGNPLGLTATVSNGLVSGLRGPDDTPSVLQISAPIAPGSSGGPVFNEHGEVIGVATAGARIGANLNFAVPAKFLKSLLQAEKPTKLGEFAKATKQYMPSDDGDAGEATAKSECTGDDRKKLRSTLKEALDAAEPLCAAGKHAPCAQLLEGAFGEATDKVSKECKGPRKSLAKTKERAAAEADAKARATTLRAGARALLDVIDE